MHRVKIGESNYQVAAAERGKRVFVNKNETFEVADRDFTKFSLIPSVSFIVDIPETVSDSWYDGKVLIGLKKAPLNRPHLYSMSKLLTALKEHHLLDAKHWSFSLQ